MSEKFSLKAMPGVNHLIVGHLMQQRRDVTIEELLEIPNVDPLLLFVEAAAYNLVDRMKEIFDRYNIDVNGKTINSLGYRTTALAFAADANSIKTIQWLLEHDADPNAKMFNDEEGAEITPLWISAQNGNVRIAKLLLDAGADVNAIKKPTNNSVLYIAVQNCHKSMIALLLSYGADPNILCFDVEKRMASPILAAVVLCMNDVVAQLINAGAYIQHLLPIMENFMDDMETTGTTCTDGVSRKVEKTDVAILRKLLNLDVVERLWQNPTYKKAMKAERKGNYRKALQLLQQVPPSLAKTQLNFDLQRNFEYIFGIKGSDARVSIWKQISQDEDAIEPTPLQFSAWHQIGMKLYIQ